MSNPGKRSWLIACLMSNEGDLAIHKNLLTCARRDQQYAGSLSYESFTSKLILLNSMLAAMSRVPACHRLFINEAIEDVCIVALIRSF